MKSLSISGVSFYPDDTIEVVRQLLALKEESHPDQLFIEIRTQLTADHYSSNPLHWTALFHRLSTDGKTISEAAMRVYVTQTRPEPAVAPRFVTLDEWELHPEDLEPLRSPAESFTEWRIFGVPEEESVILPLPPKDTNIPSARVPVPHRQRLYESIHTDVGLEFRVTVVPSDATELVKAVYYPLFRGDETPPNLEGLGESILASRKMLSDLFSLTPTRHTASSVIKAKWFVPLVSTDIRAPQTRFEQIFYGLTVSKTTPYIAYFTAKTDILRSKFYVEDPKKKEVYINKSHLRSWIARTLPQRRRPTLLLYRGKTNTHFDRISITQTDITFQSERDKDSTQSIEDLRNDLLEWFGTLDAVIPFFVPSDFTTDRWELSELSMISSYDKDIRGFNMNRFPCLHSIFGIQGNTFRLLRADQGEEDIPIEVLQAYQYLQQEANPEYVAEQMRIPIDRAKELVEKIDEMSEDVNFEKYVKSYPTVRFFSREAYIRFVTVPDRILDYVDILRYVLTSETDDIKAICPERMQEVPAVMGMAVAQGEANVEEEEDISALLGEEFAEEFQPGAVAAAAPAGPPKRRLLEVASRQATTYNYFNNRLKKFDPETFDQSFYNSECDKMKQVVVLTPEDKAKIGERYNYENASATEKFELDNPKGTAICPPFWCMRDEIPLRKEQLVMKEDGFLHCPVCDGKVRPNDSVSQAEYTVIERDQVAKYPDAMKRKSGINKKSVPCCYVREPKKAERLAEDEEEKKVNNSYILQEDVSIVPELRAAYLSPALANALKIKTEYETSVKKGKLVLEKTDYFRIGLGRPSKTLPILFNTEKEIPRPKDAVESVKKCSFFLTRRNTASGDTPTERIVAAIDNDYQQGTLTILEELEYVTTFLECEVFRVNIETNQVLCGLWSETVRGTKNTIVLLGDDILGRFGKTRLGSRTFRSLYNVNITTPPYKKETYDTLLNLSKEACKSGVPTYTDATKELTRLGKPDYDVILDPFGRTQALFVPGVVVFPVLPVLREKFEGAKVYNGYHDVKYDDLPEEDKQRASTADSIHPGYKIVREHTDTTGKVVELETQIGFRVPVRSSVSKQGNPSEILQTIRAKTEEVLVEGLPKKEDIEDAEKIAYKSEIIEFLMYSLSVDIQTEDYAGLRNSIETRSKTLYKDLDRWYKAETYSDVTEDPIRFVNKVRTPCGQLTSKDTCNKSSLCGWHKGDCKIRVKPVFTKEEVLKYIAKTLLENDKKRALVLDGTMSPFFSTVLYLEMPNELITTSF